MRSSNSFRQHPAARESLVTRPELLSRAEATMEEKRTTDSWHEATFKGRARFMDALPVMTGGMGRTFEALDLALGERVWIKEVPRSDSSDPDVVVHEYEMFRRLATA